MKRFTKHWIGWGSSDRVIPEGDPGILGSVCAGALVGTWMVPVLFYTYSGSLGRDGVGSSNLCFICGGGVFGDPTNGGLGRGGKWSGWLCVLAVPQGVLFPVFTVFPPETGLFALPG